MIIRIKRLNIADFAILQMVIVMFSFKDYSRIAILSQCFAFGIVLLEQIATRKYKINIAVVDYVFLKGLFVLWCAVGMVWALYPSVVFPWIISVCLRTMTGLTIILYLRSDERRCKFMGYMIIAGIVLCLRLLVVVPLSEWGKRGIGNYLAHNPDNGYGNTGITYVLGFIVVYLMTYTNILGKKCSYTLAIIFSVFSMFSGSRKQVIMLAVTLLLLAVLRSNNTRKLLKNLLTVLAIFVVALFLIFRIEALNNVLGQRIISFLNFFASKGIESDASTISRSFFLKAAWEVFLDHPFLGIGLDGFRYVNPYQFCWAENNFLELMADVGLVGTVIYYLIPLKIFISVAKRMKNRNAIDIQVLITFVCLMIVDATMVSYANSTLQFHLAFLFSINALQEKRDTRTECQEFESNNAIVDSKV